MARLKVEIDRFEKSVNDYGKSIEDFEIMKKELENAIKALQDSGWVSEASDQYFSKYKDTWKSNMDMHIKILNHLKECLREAQIDYEELYNDVPDILKNM